MAKIRKKATGVIGSGKPKTLHFKVSSALKSIIGRDLITDDFVAIFELVKNSFDAGARRVDIVFDATTDPDNPCLFIIDNGKGMSFTDLTDKWLFVAYSAKKDGTEDKGYRSKIYAGSKGVGRFSCDRLGDRLKLQSRTRGRRKVDNLDIQWGKFDENSKKEFHSVNVTHSQSNEYVLPKGVPRIKTGVVLEISGLRGEWPRKKLLRLKRHLAKLINPFGEKQSKFQVHLHAAHEKEQDPPLRSSAEQDFDEEFHHRVNGPIQNNIFDLLKEKTTHIKVTLDKDGHFYSSLTDRGELIYSIREQCPEEYNQLLDAEFKCEIFYLNRSAKHTFALRMGIHSVSFGSLFLFRNGFRVYPVGEESDDTWGVDRRKQQGHSRYLGTRDILGKVDISGTEEKFKESSSRDKGLINTKAYMQLKECVDRLCFRRLENYVVDVTWKFPFDKDRDDIDLLRADSAKAKIIDVVKRLAEKKNIEILAYSAELISIIGKKAEDFERSLQNLKVIAEKTHNSKLLKEVDKTYQRYQEILEAKQKAEEFAEADRVARREAEARAKRAEVETAKTKKAYEEEKKRTLLFKALISREEDVLENLHHQIIIYASNAQHLTEAALMKINNGMELSGEETRELLEDLVKIHQQVVATSRFAVRANFRLDSEEIEEDIISYIDQYLNNACELLHGNIRLELENRANPLVRRFKPIELSIVFDNLLSNSEKAGATKFMVSFKDDLSDKCLVIRVADNGHGIQDSVIEPERIFEKGFSTTNGSGLGLYHVKETIEDMRGVIDLSEWGDWGIVFEIRIKR